MTSHFLDFSIRTGTSGKVSYGDSDRVKVSLSNEHSLSQEVPRSPLQIQPFFRKSDFSMKIYGFFKKFFGSKERAKKVT